MSLLPLLAYVPQDRLRAWARGADLPETCQGAALFADISGFTSLTEALTRESGQRRGVDELVRRINAVHEVLIHELERFGGSVIGLAGDGMTCWFDAIDDGAGVAMARAVACAAAMQRAMQAFAELSVKVGVSTGAALRLVLGQREIQHIDLLAGATVARAVVAQGLAGSGEVVVDAAIAGQLDALGVGGGETRAAPSGEVFQVCLDGAVPVAPVRRVDLPEPALARLRPWLLPTVYERETASGGLFAVDLRPSMALFVHLPIGVGAGDETERQALLDSAALVQRTLWQHGGLLLEASIDTSGTCLHGNFGAVQAHEDDAHRALRAALELLPLLGASGIHAHIGLASGTMCVGGYGSRRRRSFGAMGDAVNAAARLMGLARPGEVLVAGRIRQPTGGEVFSFEARPPIAVKGKAEPLLVFAATGVQRRRSIRLQEPSDSLPMVGREAEAARIAAAIGAARSGRGQVLRIVAEAGMGKSRLLAEGIRLARREGLIGYGGAAQADGPRTPYLVWQGVWSAFFDFDPTLPPRRQQRAVQAALVHHAAEYAEAWPLLGAVLGPDWPDTALTAALGPRDRQTLLHAVLLRCLHTAAAEASEDGLALLLVLEDLQAADALSWQLLAELAAGIDTLPLLVLTAERFSEAEPADAPVLAHAQRIELRGLAAADVEHIVRARLAQQHPERVAPVPRDLLERIAARAQGNPFYVEELLAYLHDRGLDPRQADAVNAMELPSSLHSLVLSRIDRLRTTRQNELKAASVIGREFTVAALSGYCPTLGSLEQVAADLDDLGRLGFTPGLPQAPEASHVFRHPVTQEVAYESLALETRAQLHADYARHLEAVHAGAQPAAASETHPLARLLAHHFERADRVLGPAKACHYLAQAAAQAAARFANHDALACLARALGGLPADADMQRFTLLELRQSILDLLARHDERRLDLDALEELAARLPEPALRRAGVAVWRARLALDLGQYAAARRDAQAALDLLDAPAAPDLLDAHPGAGPQAALRLDAMLLQARAQVHTGAAAAARPLLDAALAMAREQGLVAAQASAHAAIGHVHWHLGEFARAEQAFVEALALARERSDLRAQINHLSSLGVVAKSRSRFTDALRHYEDALAIARRIGDRSGEAMLLSNLCGASLAAGRHAQAQQFSQQAARFFASSGETMLHAAALANGAEALRELGQYGASIAGSQQALALMRAAGSRIGEAVVLENLGLAEAAAGQLDAGQARLNEAVRLAREIGSPAREASALVHLGSVQTTCGAWDVAATSLQQAEALAAPLGDLHLALEVDAALAQLALARGDARAAAHLDRLLPHLLADPQPGVPGLPLAFHAAALRVLRQLGDPRARGLAQRCRRELTERAAQLADDARGTYLAIAEHRTILDDADDA